MDRLRTFQPAWAEASHSLFDTQRQNADRDEEQLGRDQALLNRQKRPSTYLIILTLLVLALIPMTRSTVHAQGASSYVRRVRALETGDLGILNPAGLAYSPGAKGFYVVEARGPAQPPPPVLELIKVSPFEDRGATARIAAAIKDPINMAFDEKANRLLIFQAPANRLIEVPEGPDGDLDPWTVYRHDARHFGVQNPQGMAVDPSSGHLYILDADGPRIVRLEPNPDGGFDGARISEIDLGPADMDDVRGLSLDPVSGHFYVVSPAEQEIFELSATGQVVTTRSLSGLGLVETQALVYAPSGDLTDDPAQMSLYIADSGPASALTQSTSSLDRALERHARIVAPQDAGNITELSFTQIPEAARPDFVSVLVQTIDTSNLNPPSPDTAGIAYIDASDTLLFSDSEVNEMPIFTGVNLFDINADGSLNYTETTIGYSNEPTGVAYNPANQHVFISQDDGDAVFEIHGAGADGHYDPSDPRTFIDTGTFQSSDPEGVAFDSLQGFLYIVDGVNAQVYEVNPGSNGLFDGLPADGGDDQVSSFDTQSQGIVDPEGIAFNAQNGNLFVIGEPPDTVAEFTTGGTLVQMIDVSAANADKPAGLAYAPGSVQPSTRNVYIADRGVDNNSDPNENDGKVYEMTLEAIGPVPPVANDDTASTIVNTPYTIDVAANDLDPNGNLDPSSTNITCGTCAGPSNGSLVNNGDGTFDYTPDTDFLGDDSFVYQICDTDPLCDTATATISVTGPMFEGRVLAGSDDAEEYENGTVKLNSSDLELVFDKANTGNQTVGMRFNGVAIPQGAGIVNAYIQFQVDETTSVATSLTIQGENVDNAATFDNVDWNITSRPRTTAAVSWSPPPWNNTGEAGPDQRTPDISSIIQEIVRRPTWVQDSSLAIIITGTGERVAEAYEGVPAGAPFLHVEYELDVNNPPLAVDDTGTVLQGGTLVEPAPGVLGNDSDPENDWLAVTTTPLTAPANGTLTLYASGAYTYTHDGSETASDSFVYEVCDTWALCDTATVNLTIDLSITYDLDLSPGWNLVSYPLAPVSENLTEALASCTVCDEAWAYDAWDNGDPWKQWPGDLALVDETMGLWLHATGAATLPVTGWPAVNPTIQLRDGWNLVGYPSQTARPVDEALSSIAGKYAHVVTFDTTDPADPWQEYNVGSPGYATDLLLMEPGRGYWVEVTEDCTWIVEN